MALIVQKYGGTSVANAEKIRNVARRIADAQSRGDQVVAVVSAMGGTTDALIELAGQVCDQPDDRELDLLLSTGEIVSSALLAMALRQIGHEAVSLSGSQAGIRTERSHGRARITAVQPGRIQKELAKSRVVIVAGFQGVTEEMDVTTFGRGGSDITPVALAVQLRAARCEIFTDVEGVYTADPRVVSNARKLKHIRYEEMLELASHGAKVMHPRAIELGAEFKVPILVASSFSDAPGTLIDGGEPEKEARQVMSIAHDIDVAKVTVRGVPDHPGLAAKLFAPLSEAGIRLDTVVQNASVEGKADITFTVSYQDLKRASDIVGPTVLEIGAHGWVSDPNLGKVSIVGSGMQSGAGYAADMFKALHEAEVNIELITTSGIRTTCIVDEAKVPEAVRALHDAFSLEVEE